MIIVFFLVDEDQLSNRNSYPATQKDAIRNHISTLCRVTNCVETLVIYLNNPTMNDGTSLLWDTNGDGVVSVVGSIRSALKPSIGEMHFVFK